MTEHAPPPVPAALDLPMGPPDLDARVRDGLAAVAVSYTHLTLPTNREV